MSLSISGGLFVLAWVLVGTLWFLYRYGTDLLLAWREPALRTPVLVIESDDWGPPGPGQAEALKRLGELLATFRDKGGRPAQMTIGLVLAAPKAGVAPEDWVHGGAVETVEDPAYDALRGILKQHARCFSIQLHGWMHCWPVAVARAASIDPGIASVAMCVAEEGYHVLPPRLQTRWADCAVLPCRAIPEDEVRDEARREASFFLEKVEDATPIVVPPTFIWNEHAERGWVEAGVRALITPGKRQETRDAEGRPVGFGRYHYNGETLPSGLRTLVRDIYFEPSLGHRVDDVMNILRQRWREGRPALIETHRFNFEDKVAAGSLGALRTLLDNVCDTVPEVEFLRPLEILARLEEPGASAVGRLRLGIWARRVWARWELRKPLVLTGAVLWLALAWALSQGADGGESW